eukprot:2744008-Amphidinium_carterae.1
MRTKRRNQNRRDIEPRGLAAVVFVTTYHRSSTKRCFIALAATACPCQHASTTMSPMPLINVKVKGVFAGLHRGNAGGAHGV